MAGSVEPVRPAADILGIRLVLTGRVEARGWLRAALSARDGRCRHVVTLNPEYVMLARRDPAFAAALGRADLVTVDGVGVAVAARLLGGAAVERLTGVELVEWLAEHSALAPLFLLGAGPGIAEAAAARLTERLPAVCIAGTWAGGTAGPDDDDQAIRRIGESGAVALAVAYGAPGQVSWIERNRERLAGAGVRVAVGVGGSFDYHSGAVDRPPELVRRVGLEWIVRLVREPRRWRRQLVLPAFAFLVLIRTPRALIERARR